MKIRAAAPADYDAYALLHGELGVDDPVPTREAFTADLRARMLVADLDGAIAGYALLELLAEVGYVRNIVTAPAHRRGGVGRALMDATRQRFLAAGARTWCLNVKPDNVAAIALYRAFGFEVAYRSWVLRLPSTAAVIVDTPGLGLVAVEPDDDARVERAMGLLHGQLASARRKPGRALLQLVRGDEIVGVAVFDPRFPGAFPFRATEPALGVAMLERLRSLAPARAAYVQVGVEDDEALRDALLARGAALHLEIEHMRAPLGLP